MCLVMLLCFGLPRAVMAARPETVSHTYGMKRAEILAAAGNAIALLIVSVLVTYDAVVRLVHPSPVDGAVLIVGPVAPVSVVPMVKDDAELSSVVIEIVQNASELDACGILQRSIGADR